MYSNFVNHLQKMGLWSEEDRSRIADELLGMLEDMTGRRLRAGAHPHYQHAIKSSITTTKRNAFAGRTRQTVSRAPRTRTVSKAVAKNAGGDSGDPDPEPEPRQRPRFSCLTLPALWQLLRPDNPGKNNLPTTTTDHAMPCASASPIAFPEFAQ